ncbi:T9SS type A sorting domain-containing protein [Chitinophagaceae bacterium MMS25-I14]
MTKRLLLFVTLCATFTGTVTAQYNRPESRIWAMGNNKGLDFTSGSPVSITTSLTNSNEAAASVCDTAGLLCFYSNGTKVWNKNGSVMPHGTALVTGSNSTLSTTQGAVIVPVPSQYGKYYLFSLTQVSNCKLYCHLVDMSLNGGLGDVDTTFALQNTLIKDSLTEKMTAVPGCNNSVWLVVHTEKTTLFRAYHITASGIDIANPVISNAGSFAGINYQQGVMKFSPDRTKLLNCNFRSTGVNNAGLELFNFDYTTGIISSPITLDSISYYGGTFSPDNSKVYAQTTVVLNSGTVYQFDISSVTPAQTKLQLGSSGQYADMKLAPDGKIYFGALPGGAGYSNYKYMGRINYPNNAGTTCGFQDSVTALIFPAASGNGGALAQGLPNDVAVPVPNATGNVFVKSLDTTICHSFSQLTLHAPSGFNSVQWSDSTTDSVRVIHQRGTYWVRSESPCEVRVDTFVIKGANTPLLAITASGDTLHVNSGYPAYQWYFNGQMITGANDTVYIAAQSGLYSVKGIDPSGCNDSTTQQVTVHTGISNVNAQTVVNIYPNPAHNIVNVQAGIPVNAVITGIDGRELLRATDVHSIDISGLAGGIYIIQITDKNHLLLRREKLEKAAQ